MTDLYVASLVLALVSVAAYAVGLVVGRQAPRVLGTALAGLVLVASVWFIAKFWGDVRLAALFPYTGLPALANLQVPLMLFMGGIVWSVTPGTARRKAPLAVALVLAAAWSAYRPYSHGDPPIGPPRWAPGDVCLQSSDATCSPAAAVTLLQLVGVETTEAEMAELCLTTSRGTSTYGLYRGLRIKLRGTGYTIVPFHGTAEQLREAGTPAILTVGLRPDEAFDERYVVQWGWQPGVQHTVVLFRFLPNGQPDIGDPSVGRERWNDEALRVLWHGQGFRLVRTED
jgi:hypothetical protein